MSISQIEAWLFEMVGELYQPILGSKIKTPMAILMTAISYCKLALQARFYQGVSINDGSAGNKDLGASKFL